MVAERTDIANQLARVKAERDAMHRVVEVARRVNGCYADALAPTQTGVSTMTAIVSFCAAMGQLEAALKRLHR